MVFKCICEHPSIFLVPIVPSGFNIPGVVYTVDNVTVTFEWDPPQEEGPAVVVDYYLLSVSPSPLSQPVTANVSGSLLSWDVTIEYNRLYSANITAVNCAGDSEIAVLPTVIEFGMSHFNAFVIRLLSLTV